MSKIDTGFTVIMYAAVAQLVFITALWVGGAYVVYKLLHHFGVL